MTNFTDLEIIEAAKRQHHPAVFDCPDEVLQQLLIPVRESLRHAEVRKFTPSPTPLSLLASYLIAIYEMAGEDSCEN